MQSDQLRALVAVVDNGTFDAAARALRLTPSAVSQRIKALESDVGHVVVRRTLPCTATPTGEVLVRLGRQVDLLTADAEHDLGGGSVTALSVAVNADSLATWMRPLLELAAAWPETALRLVVEDQGHSSDLLRAGTVMAAVTSDPQPVQGCRIEPLGRMRYLPVATPDLKERFSHGRAVDWAAIPVVRFNDLDGLQHEQLARHGAEPALVHQVPSSEGFADAVRAGLGWAMLPIEQADADLRSGHLVRLAAREHIDVALYWQSWRLRSERADRLRDAVRDCAGALRRPGRPNPR